MPVANVRITLVIDQTKLRLFHRPGYARLYTRPYFHNVEHIAMNIANNQHMMTSSNGNIFCVTLPLCEEFNGHRWIPLTKASDAELWCFLWFVPEQTIELTIEKPVIDDAIALIMTSQ